MQSGSCFTDLMVSSKCSWSDEVSVKLPGGISWVSQREEVQPRGEVLYTRSELLREGRRDKL